MSASGGAELKLSIPSLAIWTLTVLAVAAPRPAFAQTPPMPPTDLSIGYQTLHIPGQNYPVGVAVGLTHGVTDILRIAGEVGLSIDQNSGPNLDGTLTFYQYGIGPRLIASSGRVLPFAQVLIGGVHTRADLARSGGAAFSASANAFMLQPGAGVIVAVSRTFGVIGAVNYRRAFFQGDPDNETTVFAGVRIAFR
jgi:hypothetical protein